MRVTTYTATLELKAEKANAHSKAISSVAYSPDGSQILTGSLDKSLKVWEQRPLLDSEWEQFDKTYPNGCVAKGMWRNKVTGSEENAKPSGVGAMVAQ